MQVLPAPVRGPIAIGYLLARAADTIADTEAVPEPQRRQLLAQLLAAVQGQADPRDVQAAIDGCQLASATLLPAEHQLLHQVSACLDLLRAMPAQDQRLLRRVLEQLIAGMDRDLQRFRTEAPAALATQADLDEYTYFAAGCVGEFWTAVTAAHLPEVAHLLQPPLLARAVALGKCLQLVNVVRDAPADLRAGRCYWPTELLQREGLQPADLFAWAQPGAAPPRDAQRAALLSVTAELVRQAEDLAAFSWGYVQAIPARAVRLRLACTWPLLLGLRTLAAIGPSGSPLLRSTPIKITRAQVYRLVAASSAAVLADAAAGADQGGLLAALALRAGMNARSA